MNRSASDTSPPGQRPCLLRTLWLLLGLLVIAAIIIHCIAKEWIWLRSPILAGPALVMKRRDVPDWDLLISGVQQARSFRDTLPWWHTTWVWPYGYWRPFSSLAFWLEYRGYGERFDLWFATLIVSHLVFTACLARFAYCLTRRWAVALVAVALFAAPRPSGLQLLLWIPGYNSQVPGDVILDYWKNNVEAWLGIVVLLALIAAVHRRYSVAFILAGISVLFKETGWLTFPIIVMTAAAIGGPGVRGIPLRAWIVAAVVALPLAAIKMWVGGHLLRSGPNFSSNGAWEIRYLSQIEGMGVGSLISLMWPVGLFGLLGAVLGIQARRLGVARTAAGLAAAIAVCALAQALSLRVSFAVSLVMLLDPALGFFNSLLVGLYFYVVYLVLKNPDFRRLLLLLYAVFCLESLIVIVNPKQTPHIYYLPSAFCAVLLSVAFVAAAETVARTWTRSSNSRNTWAAANAAEIM